MTAQQNRTFWLKVDDEIARLLVENPLSAFDRLKASPAIVSVWGGETRFVLRVYDDLDDLLEDDARDLANGARTRTTAIVRLSVGSALISFLTDNRLMEQDSEAPYYALRRLAIWRFQPEALNHLFAGTQTGAVRYQVLQELTG